MEVKPIVSRVNTFDPSYDYTFSFTYSGNQSRSNRLIITDNETNSIVYDNTIITMKWEQVLPRGTLTFGKQYCAQFQSIDINGIASPISDKAYFYCLTTPVFQFTNAASVIKNSSYEFIVEYTQPEGELLKEYEFILWNSSGSVKLKSSGLLYADINASSISFTFNALENDQIYYVQAIGVTVNGLEIETEKIKISISYIRPSQYATFYVKNDYGAGVIKCDTNIIIVQYNGSESFEFINGKIVITDDKKLYYNEGFLIEDDFTIKIKGKYFCKNCNLLVCTNSNHSLTLKCIDCEDGMTRFFLTATNAIASYQLISSHIAAGVHDLFTIIINRKDNLYRIKAYAEEGEDELL